jgi:hypothetical protein
MRDIDDLLQANLSCDLHHYTGISSLDGIARSRTLWASSAYYLNDSSEVAEAVRLTATVAAQLEADAGDDAKLLLQHLQEWLKTLRRPQGLYVFSLSSSENDLSQWRAYTPYGKGVCLSFTPGQVNKIADTNIFRIIRCIYDMKEKREIASRVVHKTIETWWATSGDSIGQAHPSQKYFPLFESMKANYLTAFSSFKDQRFSSENEWRLVSPHTPSLVADAIDYRVGASMLVPYMKLRLAESGPMFDRIWIGPTEHNNLSMHAMSAFMSKYGLVKNGCVSSRIPYREWK